MGTTPTMMISLSSSCASTMLDSRRNRNGIRSKYPFLLHYRGRLSEKNQLRELKVYCWARGAVLGKVCFKPSASGASPLFDIYCTVRPNHRTSFDGFQSKLVLFGIKPEFVRRKAYALTLARLEQDRYVTTEQPPFTELALSATKPESGREETSTAISSISLSISLCKTSP